MMEILESVPLEQRFFCAHPSSFALDDLKTFIAFSIPIAPESVLATFEDLKADAYLPEVEWPFRKRSYARGVLDINGIIWSDKTDFYQPHSLNKYAGNVQRYFEPTAQAFKDFVAIHVLHSRLFQSLFNGNSYNIGIHQIRTVADDQHKGFPVPEGYHQDGFHYVATLCFQKFNVDGAASFLRQGTNDGPCVLETVLTPGEALLFNDREYFHYVSPIRPRESGWAFRDMCVVTIDKIS